MPVRRLFASGTKVSRRAKLTLTLRILLASTVLNASVFLPHAFAGSVRGGGFGVRVTVTSQNDLRALRAASNRAARQRYDASGLPVLTPAQKSKLQRTTPAPSVRIEYR